MQRFPHQLIILHRSQRIICHGTTSYSLIAFSANYDHATIRLTVSPPPSTRW